MSDLSTYNALHNVQCSPVFSQGPIVHRLKQQPTVNRLVGVQWFPTVQCSRFAVNQCQLDRLNHAVNDNHAQGSGVVVGVVWSFSGSSATNVVDTKVATKDPPSLAQPRAFSTHSSPEGWYERLGASPCSVLTAYGSGHG